MTTLVVAPCSHEAAKFAVMNWHYSKSLPVGKLYRLGVWEGDDFIGVVLYAWGANRNLGRPYSLDMTQCVELVRVALSEHQTHTSQAISRSLRLLKVDNPGLRLVVSFADPYHGHHGGIYQAGNWIYAGQSPEKVEYLYRGKILNRRAYTGQQFGKGKASRAALPTGAQPVRVPGKHRYLFPLDRQMRRRVERLRLPYPTRGGSVESDTLSHHDRELGATPGHRSISTKEP